MHGFLIFYKLNTHFGPGWIGPDPRFSYRGEDVVQTLEQATGVFGDEAKAEPPVPTVDVKTLHPKIGELTLENDFLSGALSKAGLLFRWMEKALGATIIVGKSWTIASMWIRRLRRASSEALCSPSPLNLRKYLQLTALRRNHADYTASLYERVREPSVVQDLLGKL